MLNLDECKEGLQEILACCLGRRRLERELLNELDSRFIEVADYFEKTTDAERAELVDSLPRDACMLILGLGSRLAVLAARTGDSGHLRRSLISHAIEGVRLDCRENMLHLFLVAHVAQKLEIPFRELVEETSRIFTPEVREFLMQFASRRDLRFALHHSGLEEIQTPEGVDYRARPERFERPKRSRTPTK